MELISTIGTFACGALLAAAAVPQDRARAPVTLSGRVLLPEGTPADERAYVVLAGVPEHPEGEGPLELTEHLESMGAAKKREYARLFLGPDRSFEFHVPPELQLLQLRVEGDYLHLTHDLSPEEALGLEPMALEPHLGADVTLVFTLPDGSDPGMAESLVGRTVGYDDETRALPPRVPFSGFSGPTHGRIGSGLRLRLRAHTPGGSATFVFPEGFDRGFAPFYVPERVSPEPRPGHRVEFEVPLRLGVTVTGRVVDAEGEPVVGASVDPSEHELATVETNANGEFALFARTRDIGSLTVRHPDFEAREWTPEQRSSTLELERRSSPEDTEGEKAETRQKGGLGTISGVVLFPEGTPEDERAHVVLEVTRRNAFPLGEINGVEAYFRPYCATPSFFEEVVRVEASHKGVFRLTCPPLDEIDFARVRIEGDYLAGSEAIDLESSPLEAVVLRPGLFAHVEFEFVPPVDTELDPAELIGREVRVSTTRILDVDAPMAVRMTLDQDLKGVARALGGPWGLRFGSSIELGLTPFLVDPVWRPEFSPGKRTTIRVPLVDGMTVTGRVLDVHGDPIEGALVYAEGFEDGVSGVRLNADDDRTDHEGRFACRGLYRNPGRISVTHPDFTPKNLRGSERTRVDGRVDCVLVLETLD